jgi:hypothetical protein
MHLAFKASLVLTAALTAACNQLASPTGPTSATSNALAPSPGGGTAATPSSGGGAATTELPVKGRLDGSYQGSGAPPLITVHLEAKGNATQLGLFTFDSVHVVNFVDFTGAGTAVFIAANGDRLTTDITGLATPQEAPGVFLVVETHSVTGGTGRFAGATGTLVVERLTHPLGPDSGTTAGTLSGTLTLLRGNH